MAARSCWGLRKGVTAFNTMCLRRLFCISYLGQRTNILVWSTISYLVGPQETLLATVKRRKLLCFGHVTRHDSLSKPILQGTLEGEQHRGRQKKCLTDNLKVWTSRSLMLHMAAFRRKYWKRISVE